MAQLLGDSLSAIRVISEVGDGVSDELLEDGIENLWALRSALRSGWFGIGFDTAFAGVTATNVSELDRIVSTRAQIDFFPVTFQAATGYATRGDKGRDNLLAREIRIVRHLPEDRVRLIHRRATKRLRSLSRASTTAPVGRRGDLEREWNDLLTYVESTRRRFGRPDTQRRIDRATDWIDGLIVLLSNTSSAVRQDSFHLSVSIAAGVLA